MIESNKIDTYNFNTIKKINFDMLYLDNKINMQRNGLILKDTSHYPYSQKDPFIVYDYMRRMWHLYFSNCQPHKFSIGHMITDDLNNPWIEKPDVVLDHIKGGCCAAPGIMYKEGKFHLFVQEEFSKPADINHYISEDGENFYFSNVAIKSIAKSDHEGVYDVSAKNFNGKDYLIYSGFPFPYIDSENKVYNGVHGDIFVAEAKDTSFKNWDITKVLKHEDVYFHNQHTDHDREWGLEGPDIAQLADGSFLLTCVCFLKNGGHWGSRQRILIAHSKKIDGPYNVLGLLSNPLNDDSASENGHPCIVTTSDKIYVAYQVSFNDTWKLYSLTIDMHELLDYVSKGIFFNSNLEGNTASIRYTQLEENFVNIDTIVNP